MGTEKEKIPRYCSHLKDITVHCRHQGMSLNLKYGARVKTPFENWYQLKTKEKTNLNRNMYFEAKHATLNSSALWHSSDSRLNKHFVVFLGWNLRAILSTSWCGTNCERWHWICQGSKSAAPWRAAPVPSPCILLVPLNICCDIPKEGRGPLFSSHILCCSGPDKRRANHRETSVNAPYWREHSHSRHLPAVWMEDSKTGEK